MNEIGTLLLILLGTTAGFIIGLVMGRNWSTREVAEMERDKHRRIRRIYESKIQELAVENATLRGRLADAEQEHLYTVTA